MNNSIKCDTFENILQYVQELDIFYIFYCQVVSLLILFFMHTWHPFAGCSFLLVENVANVLPAAKLGTHFATVYRVSDN